MTVNLTALLDADGNLVTPHLPLWRRLVAPLVHLVRRRRLAESPSEAPPSVSAAAEPLPGIEEYLRRVAPGLHEAAGEVDWEFVQAALDAQRDALDGALRQAASRPQQADAEAGRNRVLHFGVLSVYTQGLLTGVRNRETSLDPRRWSRN